MTLLVRTLLRVLFLVVLYGGVRAVFFLSHGATMGAESFEILQAFAGGLRFDLSAIGLINAPYMIGIALFARLEANRIWRALFVAVNAIAIFVCLGDIEYYHFSGKRLTTTSLGIAADIQDQATSILFYYWYVPILSLCLAMGLYFIDRFLVARATSTNSNPMRRFLTGFALLFATFVAIRGGSQPKPLTAAHALPYGKTAPLALNSVFTLLKSYGNEGVPPLKYFPGWTDVHAKVGERESNAAPATQKLNFVILILESFNYEYTGYGNDYEGYTPVLDQVAKSGQSFKYSFANGRRSIDALPSILGGLPALMTPPFVTSEYQSNNLPGLPTLLKSRGYSSAFFHGGNDGTMFLDILAGKLGFERYVGSKAFPDSSEHDGTWGIYDEPFLQFTAHQITTMPEPFVAAVFTLTSHHPYKIPKKYDSQFAEGTLPIHKSIRYADFALGKFFETARKMPWFDRTVFVITADHTSKIAEPSYDNNLGRYRVPQVWFGPIPTFPSTDRVAQHVDIMPTILDLVDVEDLPRARFGQSLYQPSPSFGHALLSDSVSYWLVRDDFLMQWHDGNSSFFDWKTDPALKQPIEVPNDVASEMEPLLKANLQYYNNGLIENRLTF